MVQPHNQGTAPAILYSLLRLTAVAPRGCVAIFPSDHYVSDNEVFMSHVDEAFQALQDLDDRVVLLGIAPESPEVEYGWIEPGAPIRWRGTRRIFAVRRFCEKPRPALARTLLAQGCLWNSFVMVCIATLLHHLSGSPQAVRPSSGDTIDLWDGCRTCSCTSAGCNAARHESCPSKRWWHCLVSPRCFSGARDDMERLGESGACPELPGSFGRPEDWAVPAAAGMEWEPTVHSLRA